MASSEWSCSAADLHGWTRVRTSLSSKTNLFIETIQKRQGLKIACIEEIAWRMGYIDKTRLEALAEPLAKSGYGEYLLGLLRQEREGNIA